MPPWPFPLGHSGVRPHSQVPKPPPEVPTAPAAAATAAVVPVEAAATPAALRALFACAEGKAVAVPSVAAAVAAVGCGSLRRGAKWCAVSPPLFIIISSSSSSSSAHIYDAPTPKSHHVRVYFAVPSCRVNRPRHNSALLSLLPLLSSPPLYLSPPLPIPWPRRVVGGSHTGMLVAMNLLGGLGLEVRVIDPLGIGILWR